MMVVRQIEIRILEKTILPLFHALYIGGGKTRTDGNAICFFTIIKFKVNSSLIGAALKSVSIRELIFYQKLLLNVAN